MVAKLCSKFTLGMPAPININDITQFILKHRGDSKAFLNWSELDIRMHLIHCYINQTMAVVRDEVSGAITGVVTGEKDFDSRIFYVKNILTLKDGGYSLKLLLGVFKDKYPSYSLVARRHDKIKQYDTARLLNKLIPV